VVTAEPSSLIAWPPQSVMKSRCRHKLRDCDCGGEAVSGTYRLWPRYVDYASRLPGHDVSAGWYDPPRPGID